MAQKLHQNPASLTQSVVDCSEPPTWKFCNSNITNQVLHSFLNRPGSSVPKKALHNGQRANGTQSPAARKTENSLRCLNFVQRETSLQQGQAHKPCSGNLPPACLHEKGEEASSLLSKCMRVPISQLFVAKTLFFQML